MRTSATVWLALALAASAAVAGCGPYRHHYPQPPQNPAVPCTGPHPDRHLIMPGYPNIFLDDATYGGTASWTHEGDPPAGDRCSRPPPDVTPRSIGKAHRLGALDAASRPNG
jgi:hypothetical protein